MNFLSKVVMSSCEILYLSALAGATEFIGIPDGFYGMDELEIKQEILRIQLELENKGYAQSDFDGNFEVNDGIKQIIQICALCDKYISVERIFAGGETIRLLFYFFNERIVKIEEIASKFELTFVKPSEINQSILEHISWITHSEIISDNKVVISQTLLEQVKNSVNNEFDEKSGEETLNKIGCTNAQAKIIYSGLNGKSNYISVIIVDFTSEENDVMSIMVVNSKTGSLELVPIEVDENDAIEFRSIEYDIFKIKLADALAKIGIINRIDEFI